MTKKELEELKELIIYLDLTYVEKMGKLNDNGIQALIQLGLEHPNFNDSEYRRNLVKNLLNFINKGEEINDFETTIGCPLHVIKTLRETNICYTYTGEYDGAKIFTKCDVYFYNIIKENKLRCGYDTANGYVVDLELPLNEYGVTWWLKPDKSE